jgi:hypothetical protein
MSFVLLQCKSKQPNLLQQKDISWNSSNSVIIILVKNYKQETGIRNIYEVTWCRDFKWWQEGKVAENQWCQKINKNQLTDLCRTNSEYDNRDKNINKKWQFKINEVKYLYSAGNTLYWSDRPKFASQRIVDMIVKFLRQEKNLAMTHRLTNCTTGEIPYIESLCSKFMSSKKLDNNSIYYSFPLLEMLVNFFRRSKIIDDGS